MPHAHGYVVNKARKGKKEREHYRVGNVENLVLGLFPATVARL